MYSAFTPGSRSRSRLKRADPRAERPDRPVHEASGHGARRGPRDRRGAPGHAAGSAHHDLTRVAPTSRGAGQPLAPRFRALGRPSTGLDPRHLLPEGGADGARPARALPPRGCSGGSTTAFRVLGSRWCQRDLGTEPGADRAAPRLAWTALHRYAISRDGRSFSSSATSSWTRVQGFAV